jgi:hypothetical protein
MALISSSSRKITPPGIVLNASPTPPPSDTKPSDQVAKILQILRDRQRGIIISEPPWRIFKLQSEEYDELVDELKRDEPLGGFFEDKIR